MPHAMSTSMTVQSSAETQSIAADAVIASCYLCRHDAFDLRCAERPVSSHKSVTET